MPRASELSKLLVSLDINQHNALVISLWKGVLIQRPVKNYIMLFAECDRSSPIKNFTDMLNLRDLHVDDISAKFTAESTNKHIPFR